MSLEQMREMWYNGDANLIKSSGSASTLRYPFSKVYEGDYAMNHDTLSAPAFKTCSKCKAEKPLSEFPAKSVWCKVCANAANRASYRKHREARLAQTKEYRQENLDVVRERWRESAKRKSNTSNEARARGTVSDAVRYGHLPPAWTMVCDQCDEAQAAQWHHHNGYDQEHWLDVIPLCLDCHGMEHRNG